MARKLAVRVRETTITEGTGTYALGGAVAGHQTFVAGIGSTHSCYYCVTDGTDWEVGIGTVTDAATDTLSRDSIIASSNGGSAVDWDAGTKNIFVAFPPTHAEQHAATGNDPITEADPVYLAQCAVTLSPTGVADRSLSTISFSVSSPDRTFSIAPTGASFDVYSAGVKYSKGTTTKQIDAAAGLYYLYFDASGTIQSSVDPWDIGTNAIPLAIVYWNGTDYRLLDERHGASRWPILHEYLHETRGAAYASGGGLTSAADGSTFQVDSGEWYDEDYEHKPGTKTTAPLFYRASGVWTWTAAGAAYYHAVSSVPQYDNAGTLADVDANKYSITWIYWTADTQAPVQLLVGQGQYNNQAAAEAIGPDAITLPPWLGAESKLLYRIVWQRNGAVITKKSVTDYRRTGGAPSSYVANDHLALLNLAWGTSGHTGTANRLASFDADGTAGYTTYTATLGITIDGAGSAITTGVKGFLRVPFAGTITKATLLADQTGSIVIDVWKDTYANFPPTDADSITASAPPTLSAAAKSEDATLTGWTKTIAAGDVLAFNVDSAATVTRVTLELEVERTV